MLLKRTLLVPRTCTSTLITTSPRSLSTKLGSLARPLARSIHTTSPRAQQYPPRPPGSPPPGGGFPIGNIFGGQQKREPGAALKEHGIDLTELAKNGKLDPVIGRDEEIKRTIQILSRRTKASSISSQRRVVAP